MITTATVTRMPKGIDPALAADIAARRAEVERLRAQADALESTLRRDAIREWKNGRSAANALADALGVSRQRLYQIQEELDT